MLYCKQVYDDTVPGGSVTFVRKRGLFQDSSRCLCSFGQKVCQSVRMPVKLYGNEGYIV